MSAENLEIEVFRIIRESIAAAVDARLKQGYADSPLNKLIDLVVSSRSASIRSMIEEAMDGVVVGDMRAALRDSITHKLARIITAKMEGEIEKRANELRASPEMRARMTLAVEKAIREIQ